MGDKDTKGKADTEAIFVNFSNGLGTSRDAWVYNYSRIKLTNNVKNTIDFYNGECERYQQSDKSEKIEDFVNKDITKISWSSSLYPKLKRNKRFYFNDKGLCLCTYRPFDKQWVYYDRDLNHRTGQLPKIFPMGENLPNRCICVSGNKFFITDMLPDLHFVGDTQCFPLNLYEKNTKTGLLKQGAGDYIVKDGITDYAQNHFTYDTTKPEKGGHFYLHIRHTTPPRLCQKMA